MNPVCPRCGAGCSVKYGRFHRDDDAQSIQRYRCKACAKCHSSATHTPTYRQYRSERGSLKGQGELKRIRFDPLFAINHTLAMLRNNIKRLARRNWCTTKCPEVLKDILMIYLYHHNTQLVNHPAKNQS